MPAPEAEVARGMKADPQPIVVLTGLIFRKGFVSFEDDSKPVSQSVTH